QPEPRRLVRGADEHGRGAICDLAGVAGVVQAVRAEGRLELGKHLDSGRWTNPLILGEQRIRTAVLAGRVAGEQGTGHVGGHAYALVGEPAIRPGLRGPDVALYREGVQLAAVEA